MDEKQSSKTRGKPIKCRAAVVLQPGEPLVIEEIMVAPPMAREVRVRIICTSPSRTDISFWEMKDEPAIFPRILGHEAMGVNTPRPFMSKPNCGWMLHTLKWPNGHFITRGWPFKWPEVTTAEAVKHMGVPLVFYHIAHSTIEEDDSRQTTTTLEVRGTTVLNLRFAAQGPASLAAKSQQVAEGARLCGATKIIGVDLNPDKFEVGKKFGVTEFVNAGDCGNKTVSQVIKEITGGGADYCFECVGLASLVQEAYCRKGWGKTIVLGADKPGSTLSLSSFDVLHSGKSLKGCLFGEIKAKTDIPILIKRYLDKELQLDEFVTHEVKFDDINKAFDLLIQGESLRCVIWMDK